MEHTFCNRPAYPEDLKICKTIVTADIVFARSRLICMTYDPTRGWRKWSEWIKQNRIFGLDHPLCRRPHHTDDLDDLQNRLKQDMLIVKLTNWLVSYWICIRNGIRCHPAQFQFPYCDVVETFFVCDPTSPAGSLNRWYWESRGILRPSLFRHSDPCKWTPFTGSGLKTGWVVWGPTQEYRKVLGRGTIEWECMVWW